MQKTGSIRRTRVTRSGDGAFCIKGMKAEGRGTDEDGPMVVMAVSLSACFVFLSELKSKRFS